MVEPFRIWHYPSLLYKASPLKSQPAKAFAHKLRRVVLPYDQDEQHSLKYEPKHGSLHTALSVLSGSDLLKSFSHQSITKILTTSLSLVLHDVSESSTISKRAIHISSSVGMAACVHSLSRISLFSPVFLEQDVSPFSKHSQPCFKLSSSLRFIIMSPEISYAPFYAHNLLDC